MVTGIAASLPAEIGAGLQPQRAVGSCPGSQGWEGLALGGVELAWSPGGAEGDVSACTFREEFQLLPLVLN